jgi:hypothetical protein
MEASAMAAPTSRALRSGSVSASISSVALVKQAAR